MITKILSWRRVAVVALALASVLPAKAQMTDNVYANVDWQFNFPLGNKFADRGSGWGMNFEGGYYLTDNLAVGGFLTYHSNHEYFPTQTLSTSGDGSLTTDQQHTVFQLPFGATARYAWDRSGVFQPYVGMKLGAEYAQLKSNYNVFESTDDTWGFYLSPEVGFNVFPWAYGPGIHFAAYYSFATNHGTLMTTHVGSMNNLGLRVGISF